MKHLKPTALILALILAGGCAKGRGIFPVVALDTAEERIVLPNPISLAVDAANEQIIVINSNVDVFFESGSIALLGFDATDTAAPALTAIKLIESPNFAGELFFDGAGGLYVPFREAASDGSSVDVLNKYTVSSGDIALAVSGTVAADPFGITGDGTHVYVVADGTLEIFDTDLNRVASVDLTTAEAADLSDSNADDVLFVALDSANNRAIVTNQTGRMFIVDLATSALIQAVDGPTSTTGVLVSGTTLYVLDAVTEALWVFDLSAIPEPESVPESLDDSEFLLATVSVGTSPFGMALDEATGRLYVANSGENSISVIDTVLLKEVARISLDEDDIASSFLRDGQEPFAVALGTFHSVTYLFVACFKSNAVVVINTETLKVVAVFPNTEL